MLLVFLLTLSQALTCHALPEDHPHLDFPQDIPYRRAGGSKLHAAYPLSFPTTVSRPSTEGSVSAADQFDSVDLASSSESNLDTRDGPGVFQQVITSAGPFGTVQIVVNVQNQTPASGTVVTSLETGGRNTKPPLLTDIIEKPTSLLSPTASLSPEHSQSQIDVKMVSPNIFADPISTGSPPSQVTRRKDHPVPRLGIVATPPLQTNKFYANKYLGTQSSPSYLHPYAVSWAKGKGASASWGLAISHVEANQRVYGATTVTTGAASYFINPVGIQSMCISAKELGSSTALTTDLLTDTSVRVSLRATAQSMPAIQFPLVQGAAFVTAVFNGATPWIQTGVFYKTVTRATKEAKTGITKYKFALEDGHTWLLYAYHTKGDALNLRVINNSQAQANGPFYGIIQVAKDPGNGEDLYDKSCGVYPTGFALSGSANGTLGTYTFTWVKAGMTSTKLAMFALPHHVESFDKATSAGLTNVQLQTTTKGVAVAVIGDAWTMVEPQMPIAMSFAPWSPKTGSMTALSNSAKAFIQRVATQEISQNMQQQTNQSSMYFSGKALAKFAAILLVINDMLGDKALAQTGLNQLKVAFALFATNKQQYPLVYESAWGGVVSSATYVTGNSGADFGNTYYNDHHFHYGYFIYCAAVIGHIDPTWIPANKDYVNTLVRDIANPSVQDKFFPVSRMFDWYHGHSWAHGLFETLDGKDQESSSEDANHIFAIKMWGTVIGDANMAARGNLQMAILARALQHYYLYTKNNTVQPANFIGNKVAGILFENKIDHTTYFGTNIEYIEGIHMLPLIPSTALTRTVEFVNEEWTTYFSSGRAAAVVGGWKGILFGNYATVDPKDAYAFFSALDFDPSWLDGGASQTWYLAYSAALAGI